MELSTCFLNNKNIEQITRLILDNFINLDDFLDVLYITPDWLEENVSREISRSTLLEVIELSYHNHKIRILLRHIVENIEGNVVDDSIFAKILEYPDTNTKNAMIESLAHKKLKEHQLRCLCEQGLFFEPYFELAILYYENKIYSLVDLKRFIKYFVQSKYSYMLTELTKELLNSHMSSVVEKQLYIKGISNDYMESGFK